jgi:peptide/nickel transport system permease protein
MLGGRQHSAGRYILRRVVEIPAVVILIAALNFTLIHLAPGDPAAVLVGEFGFTAGRPTDLLERTREKWGLNKPIPEQLWIYLSTVARGDLGFSLAFNRPVLPLILDRVPATLLLLGVGEGLAIVVGVGLGTTAARRHRSSVDSALTTGALVLNALPVFWTGLLLIIVFSVRFRVLPSSGMYSSFSSGSPVLDFLDVLKHLALPALSLVLFLAPLFLRVSRTSVLEVMSEAFMTSARAKGLSEHDVFFQHALPNALLPVVTLAGLLFGTILSGAVLTETVFGWPGVGRLLYDAILLRDYPLVMGILLLSSVVVVMATLITDLIYARLDPRIVYG